MNIPPPPTHTKLVVRRWDSAPLDPTPRPPPYLVRAPNARGHPPTIASEMEFLSERTDEYNNSVHQTTTMEDSSNQEEPKVNTGESPAYFEGENKDKVRCWPCRGVVRDFRATVCTWWYKEMSNFNQKTVAVSFFLFFACIAPAITFGAIYGKATENRIGAVEMILATAWCGIVYALIGGQPMMINGGTGPVLAFTEILFKMSDSMDVPFLTFNAWIGVWVAVYMLLAATFGLNRIIHYATRFTDEIFALLIATIFIINALGSPFSPTGLYYYLEGDHKSHEKHADNEDYSHTAVAMLSILVCIGTVQIAFVLRRTKFSPFLPNQFLRDTVTDFAVVSSILIWTLIADIAFGYVPMEHLNVPSSIEPTFACCTDACDSSWPLDCPDLEDPARRRDWMVDLGDLNGKTWVPFMAAGPALLAFILIFLDDGITWHLINHPAHKLTHGSAYDYDTVIIGLMVAVNALFGLPTLVAATVRSQNHVHALAEKDPHGKIMSVQETRLTNLFIHLLCLGAAFSLNVLKLIPMPVLYGVFLFMGLVSLGSNTLWGRFLMFFMQPKRYPLEPYTIYMKPMRMHLFTAIQLAMFALLYSIKSIKSIAIVFPIVIALCIPIRLYLLPKIFTEEELVMIDGDDDQIKKWIAGHNEGGDAATHEKGEEEIGAPEVQESTENLGQVEIDLEVGEVQDLALPLPEVEEKPKLRRKRKKCVSCPSPHLLFEEGEATPKVALAVIHEDVLARSETQSTSSADEMIVHEASIPIGESHPRRRRRRQRAISCPTHLLFNEAEKNIAENYFFG